MVTISAFVLIASAAIFIFLGYQIRYRSRHDLVASLGTRDLSDAAAWCKLLGSLKLLLGAGFLLAALAVLAYPGLSREIALALCAVLFLVWGPALTALQRHERV